MTKTTLQECLEWLKSRKQPDGIKGYELDQAVIAHLEAGAACAEALKKYFPTVDSYDTGKHPAMNAALTQAATSGLIANGENTMTQTALDAEGKPVTAYQPKTISSEEINKLARELLRCVPSDAPLQELEDAQREMEMILSKFFKERT